MAKNVIFIADDFGSCRAINHGIYESYTKGLLTSTSIQTNGFAFDHALNEIMPKCPNLGVGVHLNLIEGHSGSNFKKSKLLNTNGEYNLSFFDFIKMKNNKQLQQEIEVDFRQQIETCLKHFHPDHLNSHQHSHAIPFIFDITCRLAKEYNIPYVRLPYEKPYLASKATNIADLFDHKINFAKRFILNYFSKTNRRTLKKYDLKSNDFLVGILYTGIMDEETVLSGLTKLNKKDNSVIEVLLHPGDLAHAVETTYYKGVRDYVIQNYRERELRTLQSNSLKKKLTQFGFTATNYTFLNKKTELLKAEDKKNIDSPSKLKAYLILDESPFFQPEYADFLIGHCEHIDVIGGSIVELPNGGALQSYLLKNWKNLGLGQFIRLAMSKLILKTSKSFWSFWGATRFPSVKSVFVKQNINYEICSSVNRPSLIKELKNQEIDIIISANSLIFSEELIATPKKGTINRHSARLPSCGGVFPAFRALQFKHKYFGASVHKMIKEIDAGEVLHRNQFPIEKGDSIHKLYNLAFTLSSSATTEACRKIRFDEIDPAISNDGIEKSYFSFPKQSDWDEFKKNKGKFI